MLFLLESFHSLRWKALQVSVVCSQKPRFTGHTCRPVTPFTLLTSSVSRHSQKEQAMKPPEPLSAEGMDLMLLDCEVSESRGPMLVLFLPTLYLESVFVEKRKHLIYMGYMGRAGGLGSFPSSPLYIRAILSHQPLTANYELRAGDSMVKEVGTVQIVRVRTNKSTHMTRLQ